MFTLLTLWFVLSIPPAERGAALTTVGIVLGPFAGAFAREWQSCCLEWSWHLAPYALVPLAAGVSLQVVPMRAGRAWLVIRRPFLSDVALAIRAVLRIGSTLGSSRSSPLRRILIVGRCFGHAPKVVKYVVAPEPSPERTQVCSPGARLRVGFSTLGELGIDRPAELI